jgi:threonine/homoserine/homoserine lactone efflux protein
MELPVSPTNLSLFIAATFVLLITPGPVVIYIVTRTLDQGRRAGLTSVVGIEIGDFVHVLFATLGISAILVTSALAFDIVKYVGAAYLIYLGITKLLEKRKPEAELALAPVPLRRVFWQGTLVAVTNPKTALFFLAFVPQFVDPTRGAVPLQMLTLGIIFLMMATTVATSYALLASAAARWLRGNMMYARIQKSASALVYFGLGITAALSSSRR